MRSSTRRSRKMGPEGLVEKKPLYVQLMKEGHSNSAACRILGIHLNTGRRWLHGRNGVEGLVQQGLDPRPRMAVPAAAVSSRYLSEDERIFIADRLLVRASLQSIARDLSGGPRPRSAGRWPGIVRILAGTIRSAPREWHRREGHGRGWPSLPVMTSCGITLWSVCRSAGVLSRSPEP